MRRDDVVPDATRFYDAEQVMRELAHLIDGAINGIIVAWVLFFVGMGLVLVLPQFLLTLIMAVLLIGWLCCVPIAIFNAFRFFIRGGR